MRIHERSVALRRKVQCQRRRECHVAEWVGCCHSPRRWERASSANCRRSASNIKRPALGPLAERRLFAGVSSIADCRHPPRELPAGPAGDRMLAGLAHWKLPRVPAPHNLASTELRHYPLVAANAPDVMRHARRTGPRYLPHQPWISVFRRLVRQLWAPRGLSNNC